MKKVSWQLEGVQFHAVTASLIENTPRMLWIRTRSNITWKVIEFHDIKSNSGLVGRVRQWANAI